MLSTWKLIQVSNLKSFPLESNLSAGVFLEYQKLVAFEGDNMATKVLTNKGLKLD